MLTVTQIFHDWNNDPYAKGAWCVYPPGFVTKYLRALNETHGDVHFVGADWSDGWRGFIDGAIDQGLQVSKVLNEHLSSKSRQGVVTGEHD